MEIKANVNVTVTKMPDAFSTPNSQKFPFGPGTLEEAGKAEALASLLSEAALADTGGEPEDEEAEYGLFVALMDETAELLSRFDQELKYEVIEEAGMVQIQVINAQDGRVIRKIPADEVVRFIETLREQLDDHMDVWA